QALQFVRDVHPIDDVPTSALVDRLMADQHLIMAEHTLTNWPTELYLPSAVVDRDNREGWLRKGGLDAAQRATVEVYRRLAPYQPIDTDPAIDAELRRIIASGLREQTTLPELPSPPDASARLDEGPHRRANRRRG
ncbi:MAG TPA: trimethylamine methyltransferase family protein, partial [Candidatus Limnocylindrales bacterium]